MTPCTRLTALIAAALPALAGAAPLTLDQSLALWRSQSLAELQGRPGLKVRDSAEFERMKQYLADHYAGVVVRHQFELSASQVVDCVDELTQPGARRHGLTRESWVRQPRHAPVDAESSAERAQHQLDRHRDEPGIFLAPADSAAAPRDAQGQVMACARGSIPKLRLTLEKLASHESLAHFRHKRGEPGSGALASRAMAQPMTASVHEYAHAYDLVPNWGAESSLNIWGAYTEKASEFSLSQIWVVGGSGSGLQTVEAGWQVYRNRHLLSHPKNAHLFIYSTQDDYQSTGCYDLECDDFVQTDSSVVIGGYYTKQSVTGGSQYSTKILVLKDHADGHWWIKVGDTYAGYYPRTLYNSAGIRDQAAEVDFGGEIVNSWPSGRHTKTDMGSGGQPGAGFGYAAYQRNIRYVDTAYAYRTPTLTESRTDSGCYDIDVTAGTGSWKTFFYFGGEGYNSSTCP